EVNTYNRLNNVDIMVGDRLVKRYPLDAWMWGKIRKEGKKPSWSKAEENAGKRKSYWNASVKTDGLNYDYDLLGNDNILSIRCAEEFRGQVTPGKISFHYNTRELSGISMLHVDGKATSPHPSNKGEWDSTIRALLNASKITYQDGQRNVTLYAEKKALPNNFKCDY
ncbi:hypothetical protein ACE1BH_19225, partial [Aeromonas jandaei]